MGFAPIIENAAPLIPREEGAEGRAKQRYLHWPDATDVYLSSQVVISIIGVSSALSALLGLAAPSQLSFLFYGPLL